MKSIKIWKFFFWSVFSRISTEYQLKCRKMRTRKNSVFGHFSRSEDLMQTLVSSIIRTVLVKIINWDAFKPSNIIWQLSWWKEIPKKSNGIFKHMCDALRDLVPFKQFKGYEKQPWKSVAFSRREPTILIKVSLLHGCFRDF